MPRYLSPGVCSRYFSGATTVIHDHSPLGHDIFSRKGLGVYAPALLLGRVNGIVVGHSRVRVDIEQVALLMSSSSILVCRRHLAVWRICPCLLPSLRQEIGHFSLPTLYEIILGVVCHRLKGGSSGRHEEYFGLLSVSRKLLISEMEACDFVFFPSFEVSLDLSGKGSLIMLGRLLKSLPLVRGSSLIALLTLGRSSGRIPSIPEDSRMARPLPFWKRNRLCLGGDEVGLPIDAPPFLSTRTRRFGVLSFFSLRHCLLRVFGGLARSSLLDPAGFLLGYPYLPHFARLLGFRAGRLPLSGSFWGVPVFLAHPLEGSKFVGSCHIRDASVPRQYRLASIEPDANVSYEHGLATPASLALSLFSRDCDARDCIYREDSALTWTGLAAPDCSSFGHHRWSSLDGGDHP
ncbi:hypothetical protein Taro_000330 [Colocasia esculenta]|uniref:Uncharacterized protein n=1 Tax=Colocasia esculenta TaxID=4460 RepID=A0A843TCT8_COLES|nr:hypothetical protein [Colocasia esculenta]